MAILKKVSQIFSRKDKHQKELLRSLLIMAWMVEARDPYTGGHLWRVSRFAHLLASQLSLSPAEIARISIGGFLHDLGKVSVADAILNKPGRLTDEEYAMIKTHPDVGWKMLSDHPLAWLAESAIRDHHETPDGNGYPRGLKADSIPLVARIVGICDAFDAMTSTRSYRQGMSINKALEIIAENQGTQFDANLAAKFIELVQSGQLDHIVGHSDEGIPLQDCMGCGPTLVLIKDSKAGDHTYCRNCTGEYIITYDNDKKIAKPTGKMGNASNLEPILDKALISQLVQSSTIA